MDSLPRNGASISHSCLLVRPEDQTAAGGDTELAPSRLAGVASGEDASRNGDPQDERGLVHQLCLATIDQHMLQHMLLTDARGTILHVNQAFERRTGYSREEALGRTPRLLKSGQHDTSF